MNPGWFTPVCARCVVVGVVCGARGAGGGMRLVVPLSRFPGVSRVFRRAGDGVPGEGLGWSGWGGRGGDAGGENSPGPRAGPHSRSLPVLSLSVPSRYWWMGGCVPCAPRHTAIAPFFLGICFVHSREENKTVTASSGISLISSRVSFLCTAREGRSGSVIILSLPCENSGSL